MSELFYQSNYEKIRFYLNSKKTKNNLITRRRHILFFIYQTNQGIFRLKGLTCICVCMFGYFKLMKFSLCFDNHSWIDSMFLEINRWNINFFEHTLKKMMGLSLFIYQRLIRRCNETINFHCKLELLVNFWIDTARKHEISFCTDFVLIIDVLQ